MDRTSIKTLRPRIRPTHSATRSRFPKFQCLTCPGTDAASVARGRDKIQLLILSSNLSGKFPLEPPLRDPSILVTKGLQGGSIKCAVTWKATSPRPREAAGPLVDCLHRLSKLRPGLLFWETRATMRAPGGRMEGLPQRGEVAIRGESPLGRGG